MNKKKPFLIILILEEQLDVVKIDILGRHMYGRGEQLLVEMSSAGARLQESLDVSRCVVIVLI